MYLSDGSRLRQSLKTDDREVEGPQRMRLLLWHAIAEEHLPGGVTHPAWVLYGGRIAQSTKRLLSWLATLPWGEYELRRPAAAQRLGYHASTIDWLTNRDKAQTSGSREAGASSHPRTVPRPQGRDADADIEVMAARPGGRDVGRQRRGQIYAQLTIAGLTLRWPLRAQNRTEGAALVKPAIDARSRVREAARTMA